MDITFETYIKNLLNEKHNGIADELIVHSHLLQYLIKKTKPADKDESKARKSFANLYAILVLVEDYRSVIERHEDYSKYQGAQFSPLLEKARSYPFGQKIQNHAFNNRMNDEFFKFFPLQKDEGMFPIMRNLKTKRYWINENYLLVDVNGNSIDISVDIIEIIKHYTEVVKEKLEKFISDCEKLKEIENGCGDQTIGFIEALLEPDVDARLFEIVSFSILKYHYHKTIIHWGEDLHNIDHHEHKKLYKTGRTNANDGGIDFVMKPLGVFFQVTETLDFKKYFLDIDKIERYPITFVIKSTDSEESIKAQLEKDAKKKYRVQSVVDNYMNCIEQVININDLKYFLAELNSEGKLSEVLDEIITQSKVEFNYEDEEEE